MNKELEKGSFSIIVFCLLLMKLLAFSFLHSSLDWLGDCWWKREREREHEGIGVPDRTRERKPRSDSGYDLVEPF